MDEHDDDLASEVVDGEEIESDTFEPEDDDEDVRSAENPQEGEDDAPTEDESEL
jgi:hypothetical protein